MMKFYLLANWILGAGLFCLLGISCAWAEDAKPSEAPVESSPEVELPEGSLAMGPGLVVDTKKREVLMEATVCLRGGWLEFITCRPGKNSFAHESVCTSTVKPSLVHAALLLIGLQPHGLVDDDIWSGFTPVRPSSRLTVGVEFEQEGKLLRRPLSEMLINLEKPDDPVPDLWIFAGSIFYVNKEGRNQYAADVTGHTIGLTARGAAVIQFGERVASNVNPQQRGEQGEGVRINSSKSPSVDTKVRLIFAPYVEKSAPAKEGEPVPDGSAPAPAKP